MLNLVYSRKGAPAPYPKGSFGAAPLAIAPHKGATAPDPKRLAKQAAPKAPAPYIDILSEEESYFL